MAAQQQRRRVQAIAAGVIAAFLCTGAAAQSETGSGIAGFWSMRFGPMPPGRSPSAVESELMAGFPDDVVILGDAGATEFPPGDYGGLAIHESLREAARDYDPGTQTTVAAEPGTLHWTTTVLRRDRAVGCGCALPGSICSARIRAIARSSARWFAASSLCARLSCPCPSSR
jgi:hypothetical protein